MHSPKSTRGVMTNTFYVMLIMIITKTVGFAKQVVVAYVYGATKETDVYNLAFGFIDSTGYAIFSALNVTFIAIYSGRMAKRQESGKFITQVIFYFSFFTAIICAFIAFFSSEVGSLITNNYDEECILLLGKYIKLLAVLLFFICNNTILGAVLESNKFFSLSRSFGIIMSTSIIVSSLLFGRHIGITALLYGCYVAYIMQFVILVKKTRFFFEWKFSVKKMDGDCKRLLVMIGPLLIGNGIYEINKLLDRYLASGLETGSVTSLTFAQTILDSSSALLIASLCGVLFSYLSTYVAEGNLIKVQKQVGDALICLLLVAVPFSMILFFFSRNVTSILFQHGMYTAEYAHISSVILKGYAIGIPFLAIRELLLKTHYSFQDNVTPMINSSIAVIINMFVSITLTPRIGALGIAIGTSSSYFVCSMISCITVKKHCAILRIRDNWRMIVNITLASAIMIYFDLLIEKYKFIDNLYISFCLEVLIGLIIYSLMLCLFCGSKGRAEIVKYITDIKNLKSNGKTKLTGKS